MTLTWSPKDKQLELYPKWLDDLEEENDWGTYTWWNMGSGQGLIPVLWQGFGGLDRHHLCPLVSVIPQELRSPPLARALLRANYRTPRSLME